MYDNRLKKDHQNEELSPAIVALERAGFEALGSHYKMDNSAGVAIVRTPVLRQIAVFIWVHPNNYSTPATIAEHIHYGTPSELSDLVRRHEKLSSLDLAELTADLILAITRDDAN